MLPSVHSLIGKISRKKKRDMIVLGLVLGACMAFTVWWYLR